MRFDDNRIDRNIRIDSYGPGYAIRAEKIPNGIRIEAPEGKQSDVRAISYGSVFYLDIVSARKNDISVTVKHFLGYRDAEPRFALNTAPDDISFDETDDRFIMDAGDMRVTLDRKKWEMRFEKKVNGGYRLLTESNSYSPFRREYGVAYRKYGVTPQNVLPSAEYTGQNYAPYMSVSLFSEPGETYYGLGERFTPFVKNGQSVTMWNEDQSTDTELTYVNAPFYLSSNGYGVFVDHTSPVSFEFNTESVRTVGISVPGEELRFHVIAGDTPADILDTYTALTGRPALPPKWSFGYWFSTCSGTHWNEETCIELLDGLAEREIPVDVLHIDGPWLRPGKWCDFVCDPAVFKDMKTALERFRKRGIRLSLWINPYVGQGSKMFDEGVEKGFFLMRADGHGVKQTDHYWMPGQAIVDLTNPEAYAWWQEKVRAMIRLGIDTFKTDFGEKLPTDVVYHNGADPMGMHNYYTYLYNKCVFEALQQERGKDDAVLFARSGTAGSQAFPCNWAGDPCARYTSMAETLRAGLSYAMSGFSFWSHDIGGFLDRPTPDLYKRWVQFGFLSSHTRTHSSWEFKVPWAYDEESVQVIRKFSRLKCKLMPYLFGCAVTSHRKGTPVLRPMVFEFPKELICRYLDMQYMLGPSLLAAPIFNDRSEAVFYLPALENGAKWFNLLDGEVLGGGAQYTRTYDYLTMPLFVKGNTLLPIGGCETTADYDYAAGTSIRWYLPDDAMPPEPVSIHDAHGTEVCRICAKRENGRFLFSCTGTFADGKAEVYFADGTVKTAPFTDGSAIITD